MSGPQSLMLGMSTTVSASIDFMTWNSFLALVPLALAFALYSKRRDYALLVSALCGLLLVVRWRSVSFHLYELALSLPAWQRGVLASMALLITTILFLPRWKDQARMAVGSAAFLLFLPNAPYVLTDILHLFETIRIGTCATAVVLVALPLYTVFMIVGFSAYVISLSLFSAYIQGQWPRVSRRGIEVAMHALCAFGVYLGRFVRLNSWDIATHPIAVLDSSLQVVLSFNALALIAVSFLITWTLFSVWRVILRALYIYLQSRRSAWVPVFKSILKSEV